MVLIDTVLSHNEQKIVCSTNSHRRADNPLCRDGILGVSCGIEYGGQAMALHGAMSNSGVARQGLLVALRNICFSTRHLDQYEQPLIVHATRLAAAGQGSIYEFVILAAERELVSGRATVQLG